MAALLNACHHATHAVECHACGSERLTACTCLHTCVHGHERPDPASPTWHVHCSAAQPLLAAASAVCTSNTCMHGWPALTQCCGPGKHAGRRPCQPSAVTACSQRTLHGSPAAVSMRPIWAKRRVFEEYSTLQLHQPPTLTPLRARERAASSPQQRPCAEAPQSASQKQINAGRTQVPAGQSSTATVHAAPMHTINIAHPARHRICACMERIGPRLLPTLSCKDHLQSSQRICKLTICAMVFSVQGMQQACLACIHAAVYILH